MLLGAVEYSQQPANPCTQDWSMSDNNDLIPVCAWVSMRLPGFPHFIGFTYVDSEAGLSAQGGNLEDSNIAEAPSLTVRLPMPGITCERLPQAETERLNLPPMPTWVEEFYGRQPMSGKYWGEWRRHPRLQGRFHPEFHDSIQVVIHDGGPRISRSAPELAWVRVCQCEGDLFHGQLLNQPHGLLSVSQSDEILFLAPDGNEPLVMVTPKYLGERSEWAVSPCNKCGLRYLFDAPSDLIKVIFPNVPPGSDIKMFTSFCGLCGGGGVHLVSQGNIPPDIALKFKPNPEPESIVLPAVKTTDATSKPPPSKWWGFWK
jgi:hypothetical protein